MQITKRYLFSFFLFLLSATAYSNIYTVISTNSSGIGTLNNAIQIANARAGIDTIFFNIPADGEQIIKLDQLIPSINGQVYIDGLSQNAFRGIDSSEHLITLDGQGVQPHGLIFIAGTDFSTVLHLKCKGFIGAGILIDDTFNVEIYSCVFEDNEIAVFINNSSFNSLGDGTLANKNIIKKSATDGVIIVGNSQGNDLNHNAIFDNTNLGIDLGDNINDDRDEGDLDVGPNGFQNRPLIDSVFIKEDSVTFYVTHIGLTGTVRFDFYSNDTRDTSQSSGEVFLGTRTLPVMDGAKIKETFVFDTLHRSFSALATENGNTSEFSNLLLRPGLIPPVVVNDTFIIDEDEPTVFNVLFNDIDDNLDSSSLVLTSPSAVNGVASVTGNRIVYTPNKNFHGEDSFGYSVCDLTSREPYCDSTIVLVNILPVNDSPLANSDSASTAQASVVVVDIATNDTDPDGNIKKNSIRIVESVSGAAISVNNEEIGEIKIDYSSIPSFKGRDTVIYSICDSTGLCDTGYVFVLVNSGSFPITNKDFLTLLEDEVTTIDVLANDTDEDNNLNRSSVTIVKNGNHGVATYNSDLQRVSYNPNLNYNGTDTVVYRVCDFTFNCAEDTIYVTVTPQDDAPIAVRVTAKTVRGKCKNTFLLDVLKEVVEPDENDSLDFSTFEIGASVSGILPSKDAKGQLVFNYATVSNFFGLDSLQYKICDTQGLCDSSFVIVDVAFNTKPTVVDDKATLNQGNSLVIAVLNNDFDNTIGLDRSSLTITSTLQHGIASKFVNGSIRVDYTTNTSFSGNDVLTYEICDSNCFCASARLEVTVKDTSSGSTSSLVLANDLMTFKEGCVSASLNVLANDSLKGIADLSTISLLPFKKSFLWNLSQTGDLTVNYYPDTVFEQQFNIQYRLCDTLNKCDTATITVGVIENTPPTTNTIFFRIEDKNSSSFEIDVLKNVSDADGVDFASLTIINSSNYGLSFITAENQIKYNINIQDDYDSDTIVYQVCDSTCMCVSDKVVVQFPEKEEVIVYEGFSPNGDGINDVWTIGNLASYVDSHVQIFNRWGSIVFEQQILPTYENGIWDGENVPEGVYYFVIKPTNPELEPIAGTIVLQR